MSSARSLRVRGMLLVAALASSASTTLAQSPAQARAHFERGVAAMRAGRPADAVTEFTTSYRLRASPVVLFNLGIAHRAAGNRREAWIAFGRYVNTASNADPVRLAAVRAEIESLRSQMGLLRFENVPPNTELTVDGQAVSLGTSELMVDPGPHTVVAITGDTRRTLHALVQRGGQSLLRIDEQEEGPAAAAVAPPSIETGQRSSPSPAQQSAVGRACVRDDECAVGHRCDRGSCAAALEASERPPEPSGERFQRFSLDVGGGVGLAFLEGGRPPYAEYRRWQFTTTNAMGDRVTQVQESCGTYVCSPQIDSGAATTVFLSALLRYNFSRRVGLGFAARYQFDTAGWKIPPPAPTPAAPNPPSTSVSNDFANVLFNLRVYVALTSDGFASSGFIASLFAGGGIGQISPSPTIPASTGRPSAHILSGYGNAVFGARLEYGVRAGFHFGAEIAAQFMFPTFLFNMDLTPFVGFHI